MAGLTRCIAASVLRFLATAAGALNGGAAFRHRSDECHTSNANELMPAHDLERGSDASTSTVETPICMGSYSAFLFC